MYMKLFVFKFVKEKNGDSKTSPNPCLDETTLDIWTDAKSIQISSRV